ncbi:SIMPL domain-containing protein [Leucobacter chromiireducens]|uniref:SIMPL domain-containing protein n=1 Tax=Leucobacter chromiireducens TaxID=283877 RepID=UPI000F63AD6A|nr:SIMPL domain-containing protein [Leucobacter chromiireducens]
MSTNPAPQISVSGHAERRLPADRVELALSTSHVGPERKAVVAAAAAEHARLVARAQELVASGVAESYRADALSTYTNSWRDEHGAQIVEHRASVSVSIELVALEQVGALTTELAEGGVDPRLSWKLGDESRTAVLRELRAEAVANARETAGDYAAALGVSELALVQLRDTQLGGGTFPVGSPRFAMAADAAPTEVNVQDIAVSVDVEAHFTAN